MVDHGRGPSRARRRPPTGVLVRRWVALLGTAVVVAFGVRAATGGGGPAAPTRAGSAATRAAPTRAGTAATGAHAPAEHLAVLLAPWHLGAPVSRAVVVPYGSGLAILGGLATGDTSTSDIWTVDVANGSTTRAGSLSSAVHDAAGAFVDHRAFVFGGGSYSTVATVQAWSPRAASAVAAGSLPAPRSDLSATVLAGRAYVVGGYDGAALESSILETSDGVRFRQVGRLVQPVRYGAVVAAAGDVWVVGGDTGAGQNSATSQTSDIQRFDPRTGRTVVVGHLPVTLGHASAVVLGGEIYVLGGRTGTALSSHMWRVNPKTGAVAAAGTLRYPRSDAGAVVLGGRAWLVGGETTGPLAPLDSVLEVRLAPDAAAHVTA